MSIVDPATAAFVANPGLEPSLPSSDYLSDTTFVADKEHIFSREWFCIGRADDLISVGDHRVIDVAGQSILLVRTKGGALVAHYNVCRHRGAQLCATVNEVDRWGVRLGGGVSGGLIRCPYHGWSYGLEGELRAVPHQAELGAFLKADFNLYPVGVKLWGGFVFVNLKPELAPLLPLDFDGGVAEASRRLRNYPLTELRAARTIHYDVAANWKLILENYNECYHCPGVHPELCDLVPEFRKNGGMHLDWDAGIPHRNGANTYTFSGTTERAPFAGLSADEVDRHRGELLYPNVMLSVASDHVAAFILWPMAPDRTVIETQFLFHPDEIARDSFDPADAVDFWDMINRQDWAVCERVQRGIGAQVHTHGIYSPIEDMSLDIRRYVADRHRRAEKLKR